MKMDEVQGLIEIKLPDPGAFLKIKETLTRIGTGFATDTNRILEQACHILHKRGKYYIIHYKELMILDGDLTIMTELETARRNTIAFLLDKWGLCEVIDQSLINTRIAHDQITIVPFKDKSEWKLTANYVVGKKKHREG
jgi:hypothetical protein